MRLGIAILLAALLAAASAQAEPLTLSVGEARAILSGLVALDGYEKEVRDGGNTRVIQERYDFGGGLSMLIARDIVKLREIDAAFTLARNKEVKNIASPSEDTEENRQVLVRINALLEAKQTIALELISEDELGLQAASGRKGNPIPPSVLAKIMPLLKPSDDKR